MIISCQISSHLGRQNSHGLTKSENIRLALKIPDGDATIKNELFFAVLVIRLLFLTEAQRHGEV
jgi:hypothetical protein